MNPIKILFVSPEVVPFAKTGGLADVAGALPKALKALGCDIRLMMPLYREVRQGDFPLVKIITDLPLSLGDRSLKVDIYEGELDQGIPIYFIEREECFDRSHLYGGPKGDYFDNDLRFSLLARGVLAAARALDFQPDIVHGHDWQTGLIAPLLHFERSRDFFFRETAAFFTIHNLAYQGLFSPEILKLAGLPRESLTPEGLEFWGQVNLLKAGIVYSQILNTVSRKYSQEIQTPEYGYGLEGILRYRKDDLFGILNGVDYDVWNPETDSFLPAPYNSNDLSGKVICKRELLKRFNLSPDREFLPLLGIISRLADQKGFDLLAKIIDRLLGQEVTLIVLGAGEEKYHILFKELADRYPKNLGIRLSFDNALAHQIEAGCDLFLMPSRYEPCGLNQIYSLKYGTIPVVRATGGLDDTIIPYEARTGEGTGFAFVPYDPESFYRAIEEALNVFKNREQWFRLMKKGMAMDFSWEVSAKEYLRLYHSAKERLKRF
ncbi:MAG: glycogen synthase GlgA [Thermodesulfobacteriota bacterium]